MQQPGSLQEARLFVGTNLERRFKCEGQGLEGAAAAGWPQRPPPPPPPLPAAACERRASLLPASCRLLRWHPLSTCKQHAPLPGLVPVHSGGGEGRTSAAARGRQRCRRPGCLRPTGALLCQALPAAHWPRAPCEQVNLGADIGLEGEDANKLYCLLRRGKPPAQECAPPRGAPRPRSARRALGPPARRACQAPLRCLLIVVHRRASLIAHKLLPWLHALVTMKRYSTPLKLKLKRSAASPPHVHP